MGVEWSVKNANSKKDLEFESFILHPSSLILNIPNACGGGDLSSLLKIKD